MHNWRALLVSIIEILVIHSVIVHADKLNRGVGQSMLAKQMKDSRSILEEIDSGPTALCLQSSNRSYRSCG